VIYVGRVEEVRCSDGEPLLYYARGYHRLTDLDR
jgi:flavin reductase (DIM6/NTAB) family NADH-FMN oxidoreductase RutF